MVFKNKSALHIPLALLHPLYLFKYFFDLYNKGQIVFYFNFPPSNTCHCEKLQTPFPEKLGWESTIDTGIYWDFICSFWHALAPPNHLNGPTWSGIYNVVASISLFKKFPTCISEDDTVMNSLHIWHVACSYHGMSWLSDGYGHNIYFAWPQITELLKIIFQFGLLLKGKLHNWLLILLCCFVFKAIWPNPANRSSV